MRLPEKLPELEGRWLAAFKIAWWAMAAVSLTALTFGQWYGATDVPGNDFGHSGVAVAIATSTLDALIVVAGAVLLFWRRPSDPVAALLSFGLLAVPANDVSSLTSLPALHDALDNGLDAVPMVCILLALTVFPRGRFRPRWTLLIVPAILAWSVVLFAGGKLGTVATIALMLPALVITVGSLIRRYLQMEPGTARQQVKWVMLGFAGFFACGLVEFSLLLLGEAVRGEGARFAVYVAAELLSPLEGLCIVGGLLVSLLRYRLYDVDAAISRSALYAGLTVLLFGIFAASETLIQTLSQKWLGAGTGAVGGALAAALAASLLVPLHHRLNDWAKRRFQRDLSRLRAKLPEVLMAVRDSSDPSELAGDALELAMRGVRAVRGAILLEDRGRLSLVHCEGIDEPDLAGRLAGELPGEPGPGAMRADDTELPLRLPLIPPGGALAGWLVLGPHPDGSFFGRDDRRALEELAPPLARALAAAMERSNREREREAERLTLTERLAQLESALAQVVTPTPPRGAGLA